jgi:hypothetical protein
MEKRQATRQRTSFGAKIIFNQGQSVFDCRLRDISSAGAHVEMASTLGVPYVFTLYVPHLERREQCWLVWSNMTELGISFTPRQYGNTRPDLRII